MKKTKLVAALLAAAVGFTSCAKDNKGTAVESQMVKIPNKNLKVLKTEVTQAMYESVMGENPSVFKGENLPVENVSLYDAVYFCNKLSIAAGYTPVYSVREKTDPATWGYTPNKGQTLSKSIDENRKANGYRLPTFDEWAAAAQGGGKVYIEGTDFAGSEDIDEVAWYRENSGEKTHEVEQKKPNGYGLYDMSGNVSEWLSDNLSTIVYSGTSCTAGGNWSSDPSDCETIRFSSVYEDHRRDYCSEYGFRVVRNAK